MVYNIFHMKKSWILGGLLSIFILVTLLIIYVSRDTKLYSRQVMELAESLVTEDMTFSPPGAARTYASVSTLYYEILSQTGDIKQAVIASVELLKRRYTEQSQQFKFDRFLTSLNINSQQVLSTTTVSILETEWQHMNPQGENNIKNSYSDPSKWKGENPNGVESLRFSNWIVDEDIAKIVSKPPSETDEVFQKSLKSSEWLTSIRTPEQGAYINFWSGMHMSPGIAGIWQDRLYEVVKSYQLTDKEYAYAQMVLAQSLADTLTQVWKTKFTYLTKRPSAYSNKLILSMADPNYPTYVSEYSATAYVAKETLSTMFPKGREIWQRDFDSASQIGIWAGCAFSFDEEASLELGKQIFVAAQKKLDLQTISNGSFLPFEVFASKVGVYKRGY